MIYLSAIIFGIVQGFTEFFPVSSSGHLLIAHKFFQVLPAGLDLTFDVALHLSTLFLLLLFYGNDLLRYVHAFGKGGASDDRRIGWMIIFATIPAALVGYFFEHAIAQGLRELWIVAVTLFVGGVLFFLVERWGSRTTSFHQLSFFQVFLIGCAQVLALIPGMSRSGMTIIAGMALGLKRDVATHFSFLLAVPIIGLAGIKRLLTLLTANALHFSEVIIFALGFVAAAAVGAFCIRYLLDHVKTKTFIPFAVYRIALSVVLFGFVFLQN